MAEKKYDAGFTVTDRRLFTSEGELRTETETKDEEAPGPKAVPPAQQAAEPQAANLQSTDSQGMDSQSMDAQAADLGAVANADAAQIRDMPPPPTTAEQDAQAAAYRESSKDFDSEVERSGRSAKDFEMNFERFMASLYMTAMLQLGLMHEQGGQPRLDIIGARQTIDTLSLIAEKTKGNLTSTEAGFLQNSLYELRMAYVEVTNALARAPQPGQATGTRGR